MMKLNKPDIEIFVPDNIPISDALSRTTMLAISAHHDDIELMAYDGIINCFRKNDEWFTGVVITDGRGSSKSGLYESLTNDEIVKVRNHEQKKAAFVGEYAAQILLNYRSEEVKDNNCKDIVEDLKTIIKTTQPKAIYTHSLSDKHDTHVATSIRVIQAIRELPDFYRPRKIYGCEVWGCLDWLPDNIRVEFDVSKNENIANAIIGVFDSQINGNKRYDLAISGRRQANATFSNMTHNDYTTALSYAIDLAPLINDTNLSIKKYMEDCTAMFAKSILDKIIKFSSTKK